MALEKWHRQPFEQSPLFKGSREKSSAIFGEAAINQSSGCHFAGVCFAYHQLACLSSFFEFNDYIIIFYRDKRFDVVKNYYAKRLS